MSALPPPLRREWLCAALETLIARRGEERFLTAPLVVPDDRCFPDRWTPDAAGVAALARRLLAYAGLERLRVSIEMFENERDIHEIGLDGTASKWSHAGAAAWFAGIDGDTCLFGAERDKLGDPLGLVAAMAHETAHAFRRVHRLEIADHDVEERLTDVTTVYLGFGVLTTAASARYITKSHDNLGSSYSHQQQGYLAPAEMAFLLGAQLVLRGHDTKTVRSVARLLPANQAASLRAAVAAIDRATIADLLGLAAIPAPPRPAAQRTWWQRLFGG